MEDEIIEEQNKAAEKQANDAKEAAKDADIIITDTWFSMGDASEENKNLKQK